MRRFARWLLAFSTVASLLILAAAVVMWVRSYRVADAVQRFTPGHYVELFSDDGRFGTRLTTFPRARSRTAGDLAWRHETRKPGNFAGPRGDSTRDGLGFKRVTFTHPRGGYRLTIVALPWWLAAGGASVIPIVAGIARFRRGRPVRVGFCRACGYDLRASPERCPECGAASGGGRVVQGHA